MKNLSSSKAIAVQCDSFDRQQLYLEPVAVASGARSGGFCLLGNFGQRGPLQAGRKDHGQYRWRSYLEPADPVQSHS